VDLVQVIDAPHVLIFGCFPPWWVEISMTKPSISESFDAWKREDDDSWIHGYGEDFLK
jgi:hypothetical protein